MNGFEHHYPEISGTYSVIILETWGHIEEQLCPGFVPLPLGNDALVPNPTLEEIGMLYSTTPFAFGHELRARSGKAAFEWTLRGGPT
jgi:hypothetical protein